MRIGSMIKQLLEEVRSATARRAGPGPPPGDLRDLACASWARPCRPTCATSSTGSPSPSATASNPSEAELRIAQAQLVGWLEGLFHGIQATLFAQQMAARAQLEDMRRQLRPAPVAVRAGPSPTGVPGGRPGTLGEPGPGTYLSFGSRRNVRRRRCGG